MKRLLLFLLLLPVVAVAQPQSGISGKDVFLQATESIDICSGTEGIRIAVGCSGGGTNYKWLYGVDGSTTFPGDLTVTTLTVDTIQTTTSGGDLTITTSGTGGDDIILLSQDDIIIGGNGSGDVVYFNPTGTNVATFSSTGLAMAKAITIADAASSNIGDINSGVAPATAVARIRISGGANGASTADGGIINLYNSSASQGANRGDVRITAGTSGEVIIASDDDVPVITVDRDSVVVDASLGVDITGELSLSGAATSTGVLCTKSDGDIGQCTSAVGAGGTCTCA